MPENIDIAGLLAADNIIALVALALAFAATRLAKPDTKLPLNIPTRWQPLFAVAMGEVFAVAATAVFNAASSNDITWSHAAVIGLKSGVGAVFTYALGIKTLRGGKDIAVPKVLSIHPPPPPPGSGGADLPPIPTLRPLSQIRPSSDLESALEYDGHPTWPRLPSAATVLLIVFFAGGCGHAVASAQNAATAGTYIDEQKACVDKSATNAEANACRCEVKARYDKPCVGGVP